MQKGHHRLPLLRLLLALQQLPDIAIKSCITAHAPCLKHILSLQGGGNGGMHRTLCKECQSKQRAVSLAVGVFRFSEHFPGHPAFSGAVGKASFPTLTEEMDTAADAEPIRQSRFRCIPCHPTVLRHTQQICGILLPTILLKECLRRLLVFVLFRQ